MNTKQLLVVALGSTLLLSPALVVARQDQDQENVVDAARKAQAEKKTAPKAKLTIDNDNLDTLTGAVSVVGQVPEPPEADKTKAATPADDKKAPVKGEAYWRQAFADANKKLADDSKELDILQREYNLKEQQYYSDPNTAMKQDYTHQDLNDTKAKIDDKTAAVAADKQAISDLEDALRQAGGEPGWANPLPQPQAPEAPELRPSPTVGP
jgi:chromosome segregation ATPase